MPLNDPNQDPFQPPDLQAFAKTIVNNLVSVENIERLWKGSEPSAIKVIEIMIGVVMGLLGTIGAELARGLMNGEDIAEPAFRRLASAALKDITGVEADVELGVGQGDRRRAAAQSIGAGILKALSGITPGAGGASGNIQPSTQPAENYLSFVVQMALEGWLTDITGELLTLGAVEQLGDLDDALAGALGLQRTSRAVMRPFIDTTVATPARWQLNKVYRPELLGVGEAVRQYLRGRWTVEQLREELARQGWSDDRIDAHVNAQRKFLSIGELADAERLGLMSAEDAQQHLRDQGYDEQTANLRYRLELARELLREEEQLATAIIGAYASYQIDDFEFERAIADAPISVFLQARVRSVGRMQRRLNDRDLSDGEFQDAVKRGIRSTIEYRAYLRRRGFKEEAIATKELLLRDEIRHEDQARQAKALREAELAKEKAEREARARAREEEIARDKAVTEPSRNDVAQAFVRGLVSEDFYRSFLVTAKYDAESTAFLLDLARQDRERYLADQQRRDELAERAGKDALSIAQLERAVVGGLLSVAEYGGILRDRGFSANDVAILLRLTEQRIAELADARRRREEAERRAGEQGLSLAQIEQAVLRGITSMSDYDTWLDRAGFAPVDRAVLVQLLADKLAEYNAQRARRRANEDQARARSISLPDLERAVLAGVSTLEEYELALMRADFDNQSINTLVELLALELDARELAKRKREEAEQRANSRGLSLADLARAVRWNVLTVDQYRAAVEALGYRGADLDVIVETFVRELQAQREDERRRAELRELAGERKLPLEDIERAVLGGWLSLDDYTSRLESFGYDESDRRILRALLGDELAEVERQRNARSQAASTLQARQISLADFEAAVRAHVRSIEEYGAFLLEQNFDQAARSTLIALLARELGDVERAAQLREAIAASADPRLPALLASEDSVAVERRTLREHFDAVLAAGFSQEESALLTQWLDQQLYAKKKTAPGGSNAT